MQYAVAAFYILFDVYIVVIKIIFGNSITGTGKANNRPFAADGADLRRFDSGHHVGSAALHFALDTGCRQRGNRQLQKDSEDQNPCRNSFDSSHLYFPLKCGKQGCPSCAANNVLIASGHTTDLFHRGFTAKT